MNTRKYLSPALLLLFWSTLCCTAQAQDSLYRVELLVFSNTRGLNAEQWQAYPELGYPGASHFLVDERRTQSMLQRFPGETELDNFGRLLITVPEDDEETDLTAAPTAAPAAAPAAVTEIESGSAVPDAEEPAFQAFHLLPTERLELNTWGIKRSGHKVLFHETWIQPVLEEAQALPIVLDQSGDSGQWPPWQGSIKLHLSRYLHLETNLWLNTDGSYFSGDWRLPPAPIGPPSVLVNGMPVLDYEAYLEEKRQAAELLLYPQPAPVLPADTEPMLAADLALAEEVAEPEPAWPYRHAVPLQQKRRMRSNEVHYIDHPALGLVIKLTRFDPEQAESGAAP